VFLLFQIDWIGQEFRKVCQFLSSSHFKVQEGHECDMKVFSVQIKALTNVLVLHSFSGHHFGANLLVAIVPFRQLLGILFREQDLVDDDVVGINAEFGKFLDQPFRFVNGEEFWNANADL
jgi:hypothetical protein